MIKTNFPVRGRKRAYTPASVCYRLSHDQNQLPRKGTETNTIHRLNAIDNRAIKTNFPVRGRKHLRTHLHVVLLNQEIKTNFPVRGRNM